MAITARVSQINHRDVYSILFIENKFNLDTYIIAISVGY
jgi:hypothetical protein